MKEENLKTTKLQEALIVHNHLNNLKKGDEWHDQGLHQTNMPSVAQNVAASNIWKQAQLEFFNLGRCLTMTSKMLLVEDAQGNLERIAIYNWQRLSKKEQELLGTEGARVVLKFYNRKIANDSLPMYRIDNPDTIDILPPKERHTLSFEKLREIGRSLFEGTRYEECLFIYQHMLKSGYENKVVLFSNMALCHLKMGAYEEAHTYAKKCL